MEIITVKDLTKTFTYSVKEKGLRGSLHNLFARPTLQKTAVNGVSFSIERGEAMGLLGPNGAGKTTTLKMLSGILYPTAGTATVAGFVPWERRRDYQRRFAIVMGQKTQLWPDLPALDTFELNRRIYDLDPREYQRWQREGLPVTFANLAGFVVFCIAGWFLTYCLFLIPELLSFWFVAAGGAQALSSAVFDFNNTPMNLYPKWLQRVGIFLVPVFLITNFPTLFVMGALSPALIAWGLAAPWLVFALQRLIWRRAMRRYTSAGG